MAIVFKLASGVCNSVARSLERKMPLIVTAVVAPGLMYAVPFHIWADVSDYRLMTLKLMLIAILLTLSLNMINGYMGEFSCSHPGFMALGAYAASAVLRGSSSWTTRCSAPCCLPVGAGPT